jgi:hypothetical protein
MPSSVWLLLTGLVVAGGLLKTPQFPTNDPALFEYYGQQLLRGQRLYVDLWDNKLPSIYLINEFWQWLFGAQYRWHIVVEMLMNAGSVTLFLALLRRHKLSTWPWATCCFAAILVLPPAAGYDYTEFYALPLILGALLAVDVPLLAGACIALAATFWLPSLLIGHGFAIGSCSIALRARHHLGSRGRSCRVPHLRSASGERCAKTCDRLDMR